MAKMTKVMLSRAPPFLRLARGARGPLSRLLGLAFMAAEHGLRGPGEAGEEIVMVATR